MCVSGVQKGQEASGSSHPGDALPMNGGRGPVSLSQQKAAMPGQDFLLASINILPEGPSNPTQR